MPSSPEEKPYPQGTSTSQSDHDWMSRSWSAEEGRRIPDGQHPPAAIRPGSERAEIRDGDRTDAGAPVDACRPQIGQGDPMLGPSSHTGDRRPRGVPADSILVDLTMPGIREVLETLIKDGRIRTAPADGAKIYIIPMSAAGH
jgi:hypothetical protein